MPLNYGRFVGILAVQNANVNANRVRTKCRYKNAIKEAARNTDTAFSDALCDRLCKKDTVRFWKSWHKHFCMKNLQPIGVLNGKYGDNAVRQEFTNHFKRIFTPNNSLTENCMKEDKVLKLSCEESAIPFIDIECVQSCVRRLKKNKAAGCDGIMSEHISYGGKNLHIHLCLLYNSLIRHFFVPHEFCVGLIVPLLKDKHGDASLVNMYRGITLSSALSKLFEYIVLELCGECLESDTLQYGFKKGSGCVDAVFTFRESVRYFTSRGSKVFCVSLDANKAFDKVLHSGLYLKLLQKGMHVAFVKLLRYWYSHQVCAVLWNSVVGDTFQVLCGVRQGSVLSPFLFSIYMDDVIRDLRNSGYGLHIGKDFVGCIIYADDILILSCSCHGIQRLVDICMDYGKTWDMCFNAKKTQCITFGGNTPKNLNVMMNGDKLEWSHVMKYLGCYFQVNSCRIDIKQQIRKFYGNFNNIMSVLGRGRNEMAAVHLVNSYCVPTLTYACENWNFSSSDYHTVSVLWNNAFRRIFNCCWRERVHLCYNCTVDAFQ